MRLTRSAIIDRKCRTSLHPESHPMEQKTPVAVVIPVYNRRLKLTKTLESVAAQNKLPGLLIVIDDGSTDGTAEAARKWLRSAPFEWRVVSQENAGASAARNAGFAHIGELPYVCFLNSDDLWPPDFIAQGLRALEGRDNIVAAVADRVKERAGRRQRVKIYVLSPQTLPFGSSAMVEPFSPAQ